MQEKWYFWGVQYIAESRRRHGGGASAKDPKGSQVGGWATPTWISTGYAVFFLSACEKGPTWCWFLPSSSSSSSPARLRGTQTRGSQQNWYVCRVFSAFPRAGNETVSSRKNARRDETRPSRSRLVSWLHLARPSRIKFSVSKKKIDQNINIWVKILGRPSRVSSRLETCRLDLVSSRDFRLVTGSSFPI